MQANEQGVAQYIADVEAELALLPLRTAWKPCKLRVIRGKFGVVKVRGRVYSTATQSAGQTLPDTSG